MEREQMLEIGNRVEQFFSKNQLEATVIEINPGPVITRYEVSIKSAFKTVNLLSNELADFLNVESIRVLDAVPGGTVFCLEIPNPVPIFFCLADLPKPDRDKIILAVTLSGRPYYVSDRGIIFVLGGTKTSIDNLREVIKAQAGKLKIYPIFPSDAGKFRPLLALKGAGSKVPGSNKLLGNGDMLLLLLGCPEPLRLHAVNKIRR